MSASTGATGNVGLALGAMVALAALDLIGAVFARHWAVHRAPLALVAGAVVFGILFLVYARSLRYAELTTVTIGWVVLLQVGVVVLERVDGVAIPPTKVAVIVAILGLQAVLTFGDLGRPDDRPDDHGRAVSVNPIERSLPDASYFSEKGG